MPCETVGVRIPASVDYAIRALAELAASDEGPVTVDQLASAQAIPSKFLHTIMTELKRARIVTSQRGPDGGFALARPADEISLADIFRAIDGPLATVRDQSISEMEYGGAAVELPVVWMAVRAGLRRVLETVTIADLSAGSLPASVSELADEYVAENSARHS